MINPIKELIEMKGILKVSGRIVYLVLTSLVIIIAGKGDAFLRDPVGIIYLVLWNVWWAVTFLGRRQGERNKVRQGATGFGDCSVTYFSSVADYCSTMGVFELRRSDCKRQYNLLYRTCTVCGRNSDSGNRHGSAERLIYCKAWGSA